MKSCACNCSCGTKTSSATAVLKAEHRVIEQVLTALERFTSQDFINASALLSIIDFLQNFADGCHHHKEEHELFPRMEAAGIPRSGGPIGCMLDEHTRGRALLGEMTSQLEAAAHGDAGATEALRMAAAEYVELMRNHIWKEDNVLFEMADRTLSQAERDATLAGFEQVERSEKRPWDHERYMRLADELFRSSMKLVQPNAAGAGS